MTENTQNILDQIIDAGRTALSQNPNFNKEDFHKLKNEIYKGNNIAKPFPSIRILERYDERVKHEEFGEDEVFRRILRKR